MKRRTFEEWLADFVRYNENGNVKQTYVTPEGYRLGNWVRGIRQSRYRLTEEQRNRLTESGFVWKVKHYRTFDEWFADFVRYNENGNVKQTYVTPEGHSLGNWVMSVRTGFYKLTEEQKERLAEAGFVWKVKVNRTFDEWLTDFVRYNKNGNVKITYVTPEGYALGRWVIRIRAGLLKITEEQKKRLNEVGFNWKAEVGRTFEDWFVDFIRYNHNGNVAANYVTPEGNKLGQWIHNIRAGKYKLTESQKRLMTEVGFRWKGYRTFDEWLADFVRYNENGNVKTAYVTPEGYKLGKWVQSIRTGRQMITEEQRNWLIEAGFKWKAKESRTFDEWLTDFVRYNKNGNVKASYVTPEGYKLGQWVQSIRTGRRMITEEQRKRLNDVGFVWQAKRGKSKRT